EHDHHDEVREPGEVVLLEEVGLRLEGPEGGDGAEDAPDAEEYGAAEPERRVLAQALEGLERLLLGVGDDEVDQLPGITTGVPRLRFRVFGHGDTLYSPLRAVVADRGRRPAGRRGDPGGAGRRRRSGVRWPGRRTTAPDDHPG